MLGKNGGETPEGPSQSQASEESYTKKKKAKIDSDSSSSEKEEEEDDDDEVTIVEGADFEEEAYRVQLDAKLADIELKASRGDYYLSDFGCFESDFDKKDDDDDLGEGDAGGSGGVASSSSKTDDDELEDGYYEAQVMLDEEARLEAQARDALIPAHAKATQASLIKNRMNNLLADSDEEQEQHDLVTCVACQEDFEGTSIGEVVFKCGHGLHSKCFDNHTKLAINPDKCPTCNVTWELSDYGVKPPGALEKGVKNKSSEIGGSGKGGGIRLELSEICDALSLPRGTDEAKLLNRIKELVSLSTESAQSAV
jgi:rubrerythrin